MSDLAIQFTGEETATPATELATNVATPAGPAQAAPAPQPTPPVVISSTPASPSAVLEFEKAPVAKTEIKISGQCAVAADDMETVSLDDRLRVCGEFRVIGVRHQVNPKTGDVVRTQIIAPLGELELVPWDPADPSDNGIVRARP